ncbi:Reticulon [Musa troglodytarum]|uniref:Reticulon n=1 Tax=Musa troglodytarum TaxID=320322 RepID=A0A9E7GX09_9LILI|nr:Reticulon [Musa troglodytarum]
MKLSDCACYSSLMVRLRLVLLWEIATGRDLKKLLAVCSLISKRDWKSELLWIGPDFCCGFGQFSFVLYEAFVTLHTVPFLYDKYEDRVDTLAEKATVEFKKHYAVYHAKSLSKIRRRPLKDKKSSNKQNGTLWPRLVTDGYGFPCQSFYFCC